jgi:hypothetical protein
MVLQISLPEDHLPRSRFLIASLAIGVGMALSACQPAAETPAAAAGETASGPSSASTSADAGEMMTVDLANGVATLSFDAGRTLTATLGDMPINRGVAPQTGADPVDLRDLIGGEPGSALLIFSVSAESNAAEPLCGARPTVALAVLMPQDAPQKVAAITGAAPGEPGSTLCNIRTVTVSGL